MVLGEFQFMILYFPSYFLLLVPIKSSCQVVKGPLVIEKRHNMLVLHLTVPKNNYGTAVRKLAIH